MSVLSGVDDADRLVNWLVFLLALHDIGKFSNGFQALRPDLLLELQGRESDAPYDYRHDVLGYLLLQSRFDAFLNSCGITDTDNEDWWDLNQPWLSAITGHHGRPPILPVQPSPGEVEAQFPACVSSDAFEWVRLSAKLFLHDGIPFTVGNYDRLFSSFRKVSWMVAGLAVAADWIGSNSEWFPFDSVTTDAQEYWELKALPQAQEAVAQAGMRPSRPGPSRSISSLWPHIEEATSLQSLAQSVELSSEPMLIVVEEVTGGGKTEAALLLAHRLMVEGGAQGLYFALPTMATANAMFDRVGSVYRDFFETAASPSIALAHSQRALRLALERTRTDLPYSQTESTASLDCAAWLSDSRKKSLLAEVGVGTIDQALVGVLPIRHQSLRLWGLAGKVLIADEIHAADSYELELLARLLQFHAAAGGSAILLSATLPLATRDRLAASFLKGAGSAPAPLPERAFPCLSVVAPTSSTTVPVASRTSASRRVAVDFLERVTSAEEFLVAAAEAGSCACWIRNTVADAVEAYRSLANRLHVGTVDLFHSRFTVEDRARIEQRVLSRVGSDSSPESRKGYVLIATQVVEQSLDLDFDEMVSDLAPIDLLVQRAGRLHRHSRNGEGARVSVDERDTPVLKVVSPPLVEPAPADWYRRVFRRAAYVYPDHGRLWLTASWLSQHAGFRVPEQARELIEAVYGAAAKANVPQTLRIRTERAETKSKADRALALQNALNPDKGYLPEVADWPEDRYTPTRLGEPTIALRLVRRVGASLEPWHSGGPFSWERSQVQVRMYQVAAEDGEEDELEALRSTMRDGGSGVVLVILEERRGGWLGRAKSMSGEAVQVSYDGRFGLTTEVLGSR